MLGQTAEAKMETFIDTMPTIIQTHLITCENWAKTTEKAKELEHIIRKCDPLDNFSEVIILTAEANVTKIYIKVNSKVTIIKAITTKVIMVYTTTHVEAIIRVIIMANLEAEAVVMVEVTTVDVVTAGLIIEVITTTNTISIMVMIMTTSLINMAHHVHYLVAIITHTNIVLSENMLLMT